MNARMVAERTVVDTALVPAGWSSVGAMPMVEAGSPRAPGLPHSIPWTIVGKGLDQFRGLVRGCVRRGSDMARVGGM